LKKYGRERLKLIYEALELPKNTKFKGYVVMNETDERYLIDMVPEGLLWSNKPNDALVLKKHKKAVELKKISEEDSVEVGLLLETDELLLPLPEGAINELLLITVKESKESN
jgi:hypothetical protein